MINPLHEVSSMSKDDIELKRFDADLQRLRAEIDRWQEESKRWRQENRKFEAESDKLRAEYYYYVKRSRWYEFSMGLAAVAAGIAIAKLFL